MCFHEDLTHFEQTIYNEEGTKFVVCLCKKQHSCDTRKDIEEVTCIECLKKYIKSYIELSKQQLVLCHEKKVRDLQLHVKKLQREINIYTQREKLKKDPHA